MSCGKYHADSLIVPLSYPPTYFRFEKQKFNYPVFVGLVPYGNDIMPPNTFYITGGMELDNMLDIVSKCQVGISVWKKKGNNYYGDPGKTKLYSACGIPVIMTDNTPYARVIKETNAGIVIKYDKEELRLALEEILGNYFYYKENVKKTWGYINAEKVFRDMQILE